MYTFSFRNNAARYCSGALLTVLLALFLATGTYAKKPEPGACKPHPRKPDSCGPVGQGMPPGDPTHVGLSGEFYESGGRECTSEGAPMDTRGNYDCLTAEKVAISFHELGPAVSSRKNLSWMCDVLNVDLNGDHLELSMDSYIYGWTNACSDGRCGVEIRLRSTDPILQTITFGKSDQVEITLFSEAQVQVGTDYPFHDSHTLDIHSIETDYKKTGSTRTAVICHHDLLSAPASVTFDTDPR